MAPYILVKALVVMWTFFQSRSNVEINSKSTFFAESILLLIPKDPRSIPDEELGSRLRVGVRSEIELTMATQPSHWTVRFGRRERNIPLNLGWSRIQIRGEMQHQRIWESRWIGAWALQIDFSRSCLARRWIPMENSPLILEIWRKSAGFGEFFGQNPRNLGGSGEGLKWKY